MIPNDIRDVFPEIYKDKDEDSLNALTDKMNEIILSIKTDIRNMANLKCPARCPSWLLDELGYWVSANIQNFNTETVKRKKIEDAIRTHKLRSTWEEDVKLKIDNYVGGDSSIITSVGTDDWILCGDGMTPSSYYWSAFGADGVDLELGISLIGAGTEIEVKGNIYIDIDSSVLTSDQVEELKIELADSIPAYYRVFLGYLTGTIFTQYANGVINP